jgi:antitoxin PrlF
MALVSKLSSKGQITIPASIRSAMSLKPGDFITYDLNGKSVKLNKIEPFDAVYHAAIAETLEEWNSPEDDEAFHDL